MDRTFVSNKDKGLYMSIRIKPDVEISQLNNITCVIACIVSKAIEQQINQLVDIKWVNDLYLNGFKVSGILVESKINFNTNKFEYLVIGIGVNLYKQEFHPELQNIASSIEEQTNVVINKQQLINDILDELSNYVSCYDSTNYMKHYIQRSFIIGKKVKLQTSQELIDCVVLDIDYNGQLVIEHNNTVKSVNSAEVIKTYL